MAGSLRSKKGPTINRRWDGNRTGGTGINVTKSKGKLLHGIGGEIILVPKHVVMGWA
jgi:hypothetical protein